VLAGSAAYALGETNRWRTGLDREPMEAKAFYARWPSRRWWETLLNFSPLNPIKALYWSAVINGVVAVPVIAIMMMMTGNRKVMGKFVIKGPLRAIGWLATAVMAAAVIGMAITASANRAHDTAAHLRHRASHWGSVKEQMGRAPRFLTLGSRRSARQSTSPNRA
jgi:Mn2+/Fe2+ NRAMP family transporter